MWLRAKRGHIFIETQRSFEDGMYQLVKLSRKSKQKEADLS